jgi:AcrR family transcriptional regulator
VPRRPPGSRADSVWHRPVPATTPGRTAPAFSREEIAQAAIGLADSAGLEAVSMRRIAERVGCAPTSIYWYVSDKDELYELMIDAVIGEVDLSAGRTGDWRADLAAIAWATLAVTRRHRWFGQLGIHPVPGPGTLRYASVTLGALRPLELDEPTAINVLATLNNYVAGFAAREVAWQQFRARGAAAGMEIAAGPPQDAVAGNGPNREPADDAAPGFDLSARLTLTGDESFAFGLDRFLDGLAVMVRR